MMEIVPERLLFGNPCSVKPRSMVMPELALKSNCVYQEDKVDCE